MVKITQGRHKTTSSEIGENDMISNLLRVAGNGMIYGRKNQGPSWHHHSTSNDADYIFKQVFFGNYNFEVGAAGTDTICGGQTRQTQGPSHHRWRTSDDADCILKQFVFAITNLK